CGLRRPADPACRVATGSYLALLRVGVRGQPLVAVPLLRGQVGDHAVVVTVQGRSLEVRALGGDADVPLAGTVTPRAGSLRRTILVVDGVTPHGTDTHPPDCFGTVVYA